MADGFEFREMLEERGFRFRRRGSEVDLSQELGGGRFTVVAKNGDWHGSVWASIDSSAQIPEVREVLRAELVRMFEEHRL